MQIFFLPNYLPYFFQAVTGNKQYFFLGLKIEMMTMVMTLMQGSTITVVCVLQASKNFSKRLQPVKNDLNCSYTRPVNIWGHSC